jgi:ABC-type Fe3+/spermidine/putrescine transport system ATPase subunit
MIELHNIHKTHGATAAVADVSLAVTRGESVALLGHSGSGKTTLLRIVAGLDLPDSGMVCVEGRIGMVFQSLALWPHATVREQIELVLHGPRWSGAAKTARVAEMLGVFGLDSWAGRKPGTLSGGEQQRVALARAVAAAPEILLLDEPLAHLDAESRQELRGRLRPIFEGRAVLIATHDEEDARVLSQRCLRMQEGRIV